MTATPSQSNGDSAPAVEQNSTLARWFKQMRDALRVMAGTPRVLKLIWHSHPRLTTALIAANITLGLLPLLEMWIVKQIIDAVAAAFKSGSNTNQTVVMQLLIALALIRLFNNSIEPSTRLMQEQLGDHLIHDINLMILNKANSLVDISVFENPKFHDKLSQAQNEASYRPVAILQNITTGCRSGVGLLSMLGVIAAFQPILAIIVVGLALPNMILQLKMQYEIWEINNFEVPEVRKTRYYGSVLTDTKYASEVRLFNLGSLFINKYSTIFNQFKQSRAKLRMRHWLLNFFLANIAAIGLVGSYAYVVLSALQNKITVGSLSLYLTATTQIEFQLEAIVWSMATLYQGNLFINNMFEFLDLKPPVVSAPKGDALSVPRNLKKGIRFENVSFKYPESERFVFEDLNFELAAGQSVALVGENGAGKTTIVKLVAALRANFRTHSRR